MGDRETISFAGFIASRVTALYREALVLTGSQRRAEELLEEALIRTGLAWHEAILTDPESHARSVMAGLATRSTLDAPEEIAVLADAPGTRAPRDIAGRVAKGIAARRRRSRNRGLAIAAGLVSVILAASGVSSLHGGGQAAPAAGPGLRPVASPAQRSAPVPIAPAAPPTLDGVIDRTRAARLPVRLAEDLYFRAEALGPNGTVVGGTGLDYDPYRATDGLVWALGPDPARRTTLTRPPPRLPWGHSVGVTVAAWAEDVGERYELFCADPSLRTPVARQVSRTGVALAERPIHAGADVVVWVDDSGAVQWVRGCDGAPRNADVPNLLGLSYPELFYAERGRVRAYNLESGQSSEVGVLPGAADHARLTFAGNSTYVAWAMDGTLFLLDRVGGVLRQVPLRGLLAVGGRGHLTIGDRLVAYAQRLYESNVEYGFVYDIVSGIGMAMPTEAIASRDRLLWREDTSYVVATVLPY